MRVFHNCFLQLLGSLKGSYQWAQSDDAMLLGWSMTKSILNALIGIRVRQGKMSLDQSALFPEWCMRPEDARCNITVLELLKMSSGLHFDETYGAFGAATHMLFAHNDIAKFALPYTYNKGAVYLSKVCLLLDCSTDFRAAGKRFYYSSATTNILAAALRSTFEDHAEFANFPRKEL
jgi:CubicO group peptidase (beta-lactamase class C family)